MSNIERKNWIDFVKAICMIGVYLLHSEVYYGTGGISWGYAITPFYVNAFFFVSGYLFFGKYGVKEKIVNFNPDKWRNDFFNQFFRLVIPSILFSSLIYLPKRLFYHSDVSIGRYFFDVFGGISYWFTSALVVGQIVLLLLLRLRFQRIGLYVLVTFVLFALGVYLNLDRTSDEAAAHFPWFFKTGFTYTFILALGGTYCRYEKRIDLFLKHTWIAVMCIYAGIIISTWETHSIRVIGAGGICNPLGFMVIVCSVMLLVMITKRMKHSAWLEFIGRESIVFYFFSGAIPAACGAILNRVGFEKNYIFTIIVAALSLAISYAIAKIVKKYMPFLTDLRKLKR